MIAEEAHNYYLWHPRLRNDGALCFNVTPGEQASMPVASVEFMVDLLRTFKLCAKPSRMEVLAYRSSYHSEPDASEWQDRWPMNWKITFFATSAISVNPILKHEYIGTMAFDPAGMDENPPSKCGCMVIADYQSIASAEMTRINIRRSNLIAELMREYEAPEPEYERLTLGESLIQEQIYLGEFNEQFFQQGAKYAAAVENVCSSAGGITVFEERADKREELFNANGIE